MPPDAPITTDHAVAHERAMRDLVEPFYTPLERLGSLTPVGEGELEPDYRALLAHDDHMTVTQEALHESLVDVRVVDERSGDGWYSRASVLARQSDGRAVQLGVMRINLGGLPSAVREAIEARKTPLGRILIRHHLLREVELLALWRIEAGPGLAEALGINEGDTTYGRSARILVEGKPVVELLEIVRP
ncbi:hypothetical protein Mal64_29770 [Pseudobythopirellula maris]|uniref:Uncharacterized protein n=1 Tax=Pseudobythopirellula maris TaxID=2527991 RepID=A0A5C5ZJZ2_9BACT|nr:hypothetical protein [Pseudobythopirellula maris]TWT87438.1 hypothetical protein Mal64_29770 [Pseudobythopirellula maris]